MQRARLNRHKVEYRVFVSKLDVKHSGFDGRFDTKIEAEKFMEQWKVSGYFIRLYSREFNVVSKEWIGPPVIIEEIYG